MEIRNTGHQARYPWPDDMFLQGGRRGLVITRTGKPNYTTAFVEACPAEPKTFLRGEGETLADAEDACWEKWQRIVGCPAHPEHGPFERRQYRNGSGFCTQCGSWLNSVLPELPPDPDRPKSWLEKALDQALGIGEA